MPVNNEETGSERERGLPKATEQVRVVRKFKPQVSWDLLLLQCEQVWYLGNRSQAAVGLEVPFGPEPRKESTGLAARQEQWHGAGNGKLARSGAPGQALLGPRSSRLILRSCRVTPALSRRLSDRIGLFLETSSCSGMSGRTHLFGERVCAPLPGPVLLPARRCPHFRELCLPAGTPNPPDPAARVAAGLSLGALGDQCHPALVCQAIRPPGRLCPSLPRSPALPHPAGGCQSCLLATDAVLPGSQLEGHQSQV